VLLRRAGRFLKSQAPRVCLEIIILVIGGILVIRLTREKPVEPSRPRPVLKWQFAGPAVSVQAHAVNVKRALSEALVDVEVVPVQLTASNAPVRIIGAEFAKGDDDGFTLRGEPWFIRLEKEAMISEDVMDSAARVMADDLVTKLQQAGEDIFSHVDPGIFTRKIRGQRALFPILLAPDTDKPASFAVLVVPRLYYRGVVCDPPDPNSPKSERSTWKVPYWKSFVQAAQGRATLTIRSSAGTVFIVSDDGGPE
jgi:hypothetical protein